VAEQASTERFLVFIERLGRIIELASGGVCVVFCAAMFAVTILGVFFRYVMTSPFEWTEEMARFLMLGLGFLAINIAVRRDEHIKIDFLLGYLPPVVAGFLAWLVDALIAFFLIYLTVKGWSMATRTMMTAGTVELSMFWPYLTVPLGAFLSLVQLVLRALGRAVGGLARAGA